jgi:hypothetical protein
MCTRSSSDWYWLVHHCIFDKHLIKLIWSYLPDNRHLIQCFENNKPIEIKSLDLSYPYRSNLPIWDCKYEDGCNVHPLSKNVMYWIQGRVSFFTYGENHDIYLVLPYKKDGFFSGWVLMINDKNDKNIKIVPRVLNKSAIVYLDKGTVNDSNSLHGIITFTFRFHYQLDSVSI